MMTKGLVKNIIFFSIVICFTLLCVLQNNNNIITLEVLFQNYEYKYIKLQDIYEKINISDLEKPNYSVKDINTRLLEDSIETLFYVKNAEVYLSLDEKTNVLIQQEVPFIRTVDENGDTCFFTKDGIKLNLVEGAESKDLLFMDFIRPQSWPESRYLANYLYDNDFLNSMIYKVSYNQDSEYILYSELLDFRINIGTANRLNQKVEMIKIFFKELLKDDRLYKNDKILIKELNVAYENQIICVK